MKQYLSFGNKFIASFLIILTILVIFIPSLDVTEGLQDYFVHFLFFLMASGLIGLIIGNKTILYTSFFCAGMMALFLKNASNTELKNPSINNGVKVTVAHLNLSLVTDLSMIEKIIADTTIDVLSFQEYTPDWADILPDLTREMYPYYFTNVRIDLYGKAIFSKLKIKESKKIHDPEMPNLQIVAEKEDQNFTIISAYMTPALDKMSRNIANNQFATMTEDIAKIKSPLIISGEFNQVYWSNDIISFRTKTNLLNSRRNVDPSQLKMPYDHIFYSPTLECFLFDDINDHQFIHIGCKGSFQIAHANHRK